VATAGSLTVKGLQVHVENHQKLTANGALTIYAKNLTNHQLIQGGPTTRLQISEKVSNGGKIASIGNLYILFTPES
jgi:carbon monoxide dehydrogenase subunit G